MEDLPEDCALSLKRVEAVVCGVSAGGLKVLKSLLGAIPTDFAAAMVIVQHRLPREDDLLIGHLSGFCKLPVKEAEDKEVIKGGIVYIAPANYHLMIEADRTFSLSTDEKVNYSRPSIDVLFDTAAEAYGACLLGVILTGANCDGAAGLYRIKTFGGITVVQDPESAEYVAMPRAALAAAQADLVLDIDSIGRLLSELGGAGGVRSAGQGSGKP